MAFEPQKQSEEMLRAWAVKRRDAAGPAFEPDPAGRELLLSEVRRFHGQAAVEPEAEAPESFGVFLSLLFRRLAVGLAVIAVAGVAVWFVAPQLTTQPYEFASKTDHAAEASARRPMLASTPPGGTAAAARQTLQTKDAVSFDRKEVLLAKKTPESTVVAKEKSETKPAVAMASAPAPATTPVMAAPPAAIGGAIHLAPSKPAALQPQPVEQTLTFGVKEDAGKKLAAPAVAGRVLKTFSAADKSEMAVTDAPALYSQLKLREEAKQPAETPARLNRRAAAQMQQTTQYFSTSLAQNAPAGFQRFIQVSPVVGAFKFQTAQNLQNISANQSITGNTGTSNLANTANAIGGQSGQGILQNFVLQQNGRQLLLVDGDGSTYLGDWISEDAERVGNQVNQTVDSLAGNNRQQNVEKEAGGAGAGQNQKGVQTRQQVYFHADGVNQTIRQTVAVRGFLDLAITAPVIQNTQAAGVQILNVTRIQAQVSTGTNAPRDMVAVPVK
jgi:hypothetical protein